MTTQLLGFMADPTQKTENSESERTKRESYIYFIKQKLIGLIAVVIGILALKIDEGITASIFLIPYGFAAMISKSRMITEGSDYNA